jgi:hypothetical protein
MDSGISSPHPAFTEPTLECGNSDAASQANAADTSSQRPSEAPPSPMVGSLAGLTARNRPETEPAREAEHGEYPLKGLSRLPPEIIGQVADKLPPQDVIAFADASQGLRDTLADDKHSATLMARARRVRTPGEARELLTNIQTDIPKPHRQATALATLIRTIDPTGLSWPLSEQESLVRSWPDSEHTALFDDVWAAIMRLPPQYQAEPLESFAPTLRHQPDGEPRSDRFDAFFHQIAPLSPELRVRPLAALARLIPYQSPAGQQATYDAVLVHVPQLAAEHRRPVLAALMALAPFLRHLPEPATKFDALLRETRQLPAPDQGPMLALLAPTLHFQSQPERAAQFVALLDATTQLPAPDQGPTLSRLAPYILDLPANDQQAALEHAMQIIDKFAPEQRVMPLEAFARHTRRMAEPTRAPASEASRM